MSAEVHHLRIKLNDIILTGVDGSHTASKAAEIAASLAVDLKCDLYVISAYDPSQVSLPKVGRFPSTSGAAEEFATHRKALETQAQTAAQIAEDTAILLRAQFTNLNIIAKGIEGTPADAIVEEAEKLQTRFVVLGNKHVQGVSRILGSVAAAVARRIKTDLYIAHTR
jgi:nucleotide-binding universal stress UspA family protein